MKSIGSITQLLSLTLVFSSVLFLAPAGTLADDRFFPLIVRGGNSAPAFSTKYENGILRVQFGKSRVAASDDPKNYEWLPPGSAAWVDRPLNKNEPFRLEQKVAPNIAEAAMMALHDSSGFWEFSCRNTGSGYFEVLSSRPARRPSQRFD